MTIDDVIAAEITWWHEYANMPELKMTVKAGTLPKQDTFVYEAIPLSDKSEYPNDQFLISTNHWPIARFVLIRNADGDPSLHGNLGGIYQLTNGGFLRSRTGWSSRPGVVNKKYWDRLPGGIEIMDISVREEGSYSSYWAGFYFSVEFARKVIAKFCPDTLLIRELRFAEGEPGWYPSIDSNEVVKP